MYGGFLIVFFYILIHIITEMIKNGLAKYVLNLLHSSYQSNEENSKKFQIDELIESRD